MEEGGGLEEGRTNSCSGKSTYKKDVREGREQTFVMETHEKREGGGQMLQVERVYAGWSWEGR